MTPASLVVEFDQILPSPVRDMFVPQPALESLQFGHYTTEKENDTLDSGVEEEVYMFAFSGVRSEVTRIAIAASIEGAILSIPAPLPNASWSVHMNMPKLVCHDLEHDVRQNISTNIQTALNASTYGAGTTRDTPYYSIFKSYLAWCFPCSTDLESSFTDVNDYILPYHQDPNTGTWSLSSTTPGVMHAGGATIMFEIGVFPRAAISVFPEGFDRDNPFDDSSLIDYYFQDATLMQCSLVTGHYDLDFAYDDNNAQQLSRSEG